MGLRSRKTFDLKLCKSEKIGGYLKLFARILFLYFCSRRSSFSACWLSANACHHTAEAVRITVAVATVALTMKIIIIKR